MEALRHASASGVGPSELPAAENIGCQSTELRLTFQMAGHLIFQCAEGLWGLGLTDCRTAETTN